MKGPLYDTSLPFTEPALIIAYTQWFYKADCITFLQKGSMFYVLLYDSQRKLSRRERRRLSQMEREKERELACSLGRGPHHDPYRCLCFLISFQYYFKSL
jgi:hypothetical protein